MTKKTASEPTQNKEPSEQALLAEYQVCQQEASDAGRYSWQSGIVFFVTALTLAGAALTGLLNAQLNIYKLLLIFILGTFSIILLYAYKKYLQRQHFMRKLMYDRMVIIEKQKGLRKNLYVRFLDNVKDDDYEKWLPKFERDMLSKKYRNDPGCRPRGFIWIHRVIRFAIGAWVFLIILEVVMYLSPVFRQWLLN